MADWSTKSDSQIEFEMDAAEARGYARGQAEVLAKVRLLPTPIDRTSPSGRDSCLWCGWSWWRLTEHEQHTTACLWAEAHAEPREEDR